MNTSFKVNPLVSIITPSYNKSQYISETIDSVLAQTYTNWEMIIIDDVSADKSVDIVNTFKQKDNRINLFTNTENKGANYCRNFGVEKAKGELIIFLDSDDVLAMACLENRVKVMKEKPWLDFAVFTMGVFTKNIGDNNSKWFPQSKNPLSDFLQHKLPWQTMQPIWKKSLIESVKGFDTEFERLQDVEFHTRVLFADGIKFECFNSSPDCYYRIDETRMNFSDFEFFKKWVDSSVRYYYKFYYLARAKKMEKKLIGTQFKSYLQILNAYRIKKINKDQFEVLEQELIYPKENMHYSFFKLFSFRILKKANLMPIHIKGINWVIYNFLLIR